MELTLLLSLEPVPIRPDCLFARACATGEARTLHTCTAAAAGKRTVGSDGNGLKGQEQCQFHGQIELQVTVARQPEEKCQFHGQIEFQVTVAAISSGRQQWQVIYTVHSCASYSKLHQAEC